jgi:diaminopimelate epimerase
MTVETLAGIRTPVIERGHVRVDMGAPVLEAARVPTRPKGRVIDHPFSLRAPKTEVDLEMTCVSMGNPHAVIFVDDVAQVPLRNGGP